MAIGMRTGTFLAAGGALAHTLAARIDGADVCRCQRSRRLREAAAGCRRSKKSAGQCASSWFAASVVGRMFVFFGRFFVLCAPNRIAARDGDFAMDCI